MRRLIVLFTELLLIIAALFIADAWQESGRIIPRSLIHLPEVDYSRAEFWTILKIFLGMHFFALLIMQFKCGAWVYSDTRRTVNELYLVIATYSLAALTVFLATSVSFDPQLIAGIGLCSAGLFSLVHLIAATVSGKKPHRAIIEYFSSLAKRLFSFTGIVVLILALTPPILAYAFTSNRDVANVITQIRINLSNLFSTSHSYSLVSISGDYRFKQPMLARNAPNDPSTLYILERSGRILSSPYPFDPLSAPEVVMDLEDKVGYVEVENGALGFSFHPEFGDPGSSNKGYVYLYYTDVRDDKQVNRVSRFDLSAGSATEIINTETPLLTLNRESSGYHNGGSVEFGPDGFLYIALGEGIHLKERSQAQTLREGVIRIDVDSRGGNISHPVISQPVNGQAENYFIPNDNPFVGRTDIREEYWATGLRNPFRMSFDAATGQLWLGDVGSTKWEEVNLIIKGANYQFPYTEGFETDAALKPEIIIGEEKTPVYTYLHTAYDRAVIGGVIYRSQQFPELAGKYIFADNYSSKIFVMPADKARVNDVQEIARAQQFAQRGISSVSQLENGDVLVTTLGRSSAASGEVLKLTNKAQSAEQATDKAAAQTPPLEISSIEAKEIFVTNCARCHGSTGQANGPDSALLGVQIADFYSASFQASRSDEQLRLIISKGGNEAGLSPLMPPWEGILEPQEIDALVNFVRSLGKEQ